MDEPRARPSDSVAVAIANLNNLVDDVDSRALERVKALDRLVDARFNAAETALTAAKEALDSKMKAGDQELLSHIQAQRVSVDAALKSLQELDRERDKAQNKFESNVHDRFATVNEFRAALEDLGKTMATRRETEDLKKTTDQRFDEVSKQLVGFGSRLDIGNPAINTLQTAYAAQQARAGGMSDGMKALAAVLSTTLVMIGIYTAIRATENSGSRDNSPRVVTVTTP